MGMKTGNNTLTLHLDFHWYDMIYSGEKRKEYRKIKAYNIKRLCYFWNTDPRARYDCKGIDCGKCFVDSPEWRCNPYEYVVFYRGYTKEKMKFRVKSICYGKGRAEWGAPEGETVFIIRLGEKVKTK